MLTYIVMRWLFIGIVASVGVSSAYLSYLTDNTPLYSTLVFLSIAALLMLQGHYHNRVKRSINTLVRQQDGNFEKGDVLAYLDQLIANDSSNPLRPDLDIHEILTGADLGYWCWYPQTNKLEVNETWLKQLGLNEQDFGGTSEDWSRRLHPKDAAISEQLLTKQSDNLKPFRAEFRLRHQKGHWVWLASAGSVVRHDKHGKAVKICGTHQVIDRRKRQQVALIERNRVLEKLATGAEFSVILDSLVHYIEELIPEVRGSLLLIDQDKQQLVLGAAPRLPDFYNQAVAGVTIGEGVGSCGTAAHRGETVICSDIQNHPFWQDFSELAQRAKLAACWSEPVKNGRGEVLASLAVYSNSPREPSMEELHRMTEVAHLASIAIESKQREIKLRQTSAVFDNASEGMIITDENTQIIAVNEAFTAITGYSEADIMGLTPAALQSGRQDKAFYRELWRSIQEHGFWRGEIWNRRKDGTIYPEWLSISRVINDSGEVINYVASFSDITPLKNTEQRLQYMAHHDSLTGLPNRDLFNLRLEQAIEKTKQQNHKLAVLFIDLDNFKHINDSLGHDVGDEVLRTLAERLNIAQSTHNTIARLGGDEFAIVMEGINSAQQASDLARQVLLAVNPEIKLSSHRFSLGVSIGISIFPEDGSSPVELLRNADSAMYHAKANGRNQFYHYTQDLTDNAFERMFLEHDLRKAIANNEFTVLYQPKFSLSDGSLCGAEALVRWQHPELGLVPPDTFIPLAEETGLVVPLGLAVLRLACRDVAAWHRDGHNPGRVSINLAGKQLRGPNIVTQIALIIAETGCNPEWLELEITESFIMSEAENSIEKLQDIRDMGIRLAIDDFGTGYSSLSYLKRLPIDVLKIDRSFVQGVPDDEEDCAIIQAITALAKSLDLSLIAEGVENDQQAAFLQSIGCNEVQGFHYAMPMAKDVLTKRYFSRHGHNQSPCLLISQ
jgi:diguanylate cyclase (GGDEF)-like protein/PAS domain S-box-containing protein